MTTASLQPAAPGTVAPDFQLPSTAGGKVSPADFRGRQSVLLAFFPLAFTSTCTEQVCELSTDFDQFTEADVAVLPISVDSVPTLREFKAKYGIRVDMLSDFRRDASRAYGVLVEDRFHSARAYFLIDREGIIRWVHVEEHGGFKRSTAELMEQIRSKLG